MFNSKQCVGSGSDPIWNYLQDPDPQFKLLIRIREGSGIKCFYNKWSDQIHEIFLDPTH